MATDLDIAASHQRQGAVGTGAAAAVVFARLLIGWLVLICAEVFSGASLRMGLWHPWTLLVTYWLYFAHFFLFTTLAVRTGRTSLPSLYLWGVLFGLYESWITKVIWHGYGGDGKFCLGAVGPYGYSEISMVFLFHPVMSFILPLGVACLLCPSLRGAFPGLGWLAGAGRWGRLVQAGMMLAFAPIMAVNSGGPVNLAVNVALAVAVLFVLARRARAALAGPGLAIVAFGNRGLVGLCAYLGLLYGLAYFFLNPAGLPSPAVQAVTLAFYAVPILGLWRHRAVRPAGAAGTDCRREVRFVKRWFAALVILALALSLVGRAQWLALPIRIDLAAWTPLGVALTAAALVRR